MNRIIYLFWILATIVVSGCGGSDTVEGMLAAGQDAFDRRSYTEAREYYLRGLAVDNKNRDLLLGVALAYRKDYLLDSALHYLKRADLMQPDDREVNEEIRELAKALGDWQNAIDAIETLARLDGTREPYHIELADLRLKNGQPGRAYYHARRALLAGPDIPGLYLQTASMASTYDSVGVAIEILDAAIAKFGPQDEFVVNRAMLQAYTGNLGEAEATLRSVITQSEIPQPALKLNLANILAAQPQRAKKEEALRIYEEIYAELSDSFPIDSLMGVVREALK